MFPIFSFQEQGTQANVNDFASQGSVYVSLDPIPLANLPMSDVEDLNSNIDLNDSIDFIPELDDIEAEAISDDNVSISREHDDSNEIPDLEDTEEEIQTDYRRYRQRKTETERRRRANESQEQRERRQTQDRLWHQADREVVEVQTVQRRRKKNTLEKGGWDYNVATFQLHHHQNFNIGCMNVICTSCQAKRFPKEPKGLCCKSGKVSDVPLIPAPPDEMVPLFTLENTRGKQFLGNARKYNQAFHMTSIKTNWVVEPGFMPTVKIQGQMSHMLGPLQPADGDEAKFLQIYFIGKTSDNI